MSESTERKTNVGGRHSPKRVASRLRAVQAVELRLQGLGYAEIAERVGFRGPGSAYTAIHTMLRQTAQPPADELRLLELERLDALLRAVWPLAIGEDPAEPEAERRAPDLHAVEIVLKIERQRARLLGLDAPQMFNVRQFIMRIAESEGFSPEETADAVEFVEHHLRELRDGG